jgi:hypothetical protein
MLKTKSPRYNSMAPRQTEASKHLWDDFVRQVGSYARRNNVAYGGLPPAERSQRINQSAMAWYNKAPVAAR